jgi:hypothetical protein
MVVKHNLMIYNWFYVLSVDVGENEDILTIEGYVDPNDEPITLQYTFTDRDSLEQAYGLLTLGISQGLSLIDFDELTALSPNGQVVSFVEEDLLTKKDNVEIVQSNAPVKQQDDNYEFKWEFEWE